MRTQHRLIAAFGAAAICVIIACGIARAQIATSPASDPVKALLLSDADSVPAGKSFTAAVLLTIEPAWHIYWKNPGDAGLATSVTFTVPPGYTVGPLAWPQPKTFQQPGNITEYGYENEVLLTATITPPPQGQAIDVIPIEADVTFLACKDKCVPGKTSAKGKVTVVADAKDARPANTDIFAAWADRFDPVAPPFTLKDSAGKDVSLNDFAGKIVVLEWINPECPFSQRHHVAKSTMTDLAGKYAPKGVVWLSINSTASMDAATSQKWHDQWKLPYPILVDRGGDVGRAYSAKTTPHMFVISPEGRIVYRGAIDDDPTGRNATPVNYVDQALSELLAGKPVSKPVIASYGCSIKYAANAAPTHP